MEKCVEVSGTTLVIKVPRELDHHSAEYLRGEADRILGEKSIRSIVFDFERTSFMDSSGIGLIMGRYKNIRFTGGKVTAVRANEQIRRILTLSGMHKVIEIYEGEPEILERGRGR
ncbi:anti-sigma factor antagonist [Lachnospiraceae bacterium 46-15]